MYINLVGLARRTGGVSPTSTGSVCACACRVAVYAASIRSAGHSPTGVEINAKLTSLPDHPVGANQCWPLANHSAAVHSPLAMHAVADLGFFLSSRALTLSQVRL